MGIFLWRKEMFRGDTTMRVVVCCDSSIRVKLAESHEEKVADQHRNVAVIAFQSTRLSVPS